MWRRSQIFCVLLAWLLATGSQWDLVQTFAWGRMIVSYSRTMPLLEAVRLTFTPDNECAICNTVSAAKQQLDSPATPDLKLLGKIILVFQPAPVLVIAAPNLSRWPLGDIVVPGASRAAPPLPPPRVV